MPQSGRRAIGTREAKDGVWTPCRFRSGWSKLGELDSPTQEERMTVAQIFIIGGLSLAVVALLMVRQRSTS